MQLGQDAEAAEALRLALHSNPQYVRGHAYLAAAEALLGDIDRASSISTNWRNSIQA